MVAARNDEEAVQFPVDEPVNLDLTPVAEFGTLEDLKNYKPKVEEVYIPELNKKFYIRYLDGREVDRYRSSITVGKGMNQTVEQRGMRAKLIVLALGDANGNRLLSDKETTMVQEWRSHILERLFDKARKINGLTDEDTDSDPGNS